MSSSTPEREAHALLEAGRLAEAEVAWRAILARRPADAAALHFLGCVLARSGRVDEGLALIGNSLERDPRNTAFLANRALVLADAGRLEEAVADLRRALQRDPASAPACFHLGTLLARLGRGEEAVVALRKAAALDARHAGAHAALGRALLEAGDAAGARAVLERALQLRPGDPDVLNNLGLALAAQGSREAAAARYAEALERRPGFAGALLNWGHALRDGGDLDSAARLYARASEADPALVEATLAQAGAALDLGDLGQARALYAHALALRPGSADARYGVGQVALREHRFAEGWEGYEARFATRPPQAAVADAGLPRLAPANLAHARRVAVCREQGLGDQVIFCTLLPELVGGGREAVVDVDPRLAPILARCVAGIRVAPSSQDARAFQGCDTQVALGSLPALFRRDTASFARQPRVLLDADAVRTAAMRAALGAGRHVGVSWRSFQDSERAWLAARKSAPLEALAAVAEAADARLVDLQYGDAGEERARFEARHPGMLTRIAGLDTRGDIEGVLAAIAACDAIVTTSNVTAHFAGAIGKQTYLACLGANPPFHYWVPGPDGRSLWYPAVRVVADAALDTWEKVFARIAAMLAAG